MSRLDLGLDFKKLSQSSIVKSVREHINGYEKTVNDLVQDFNIRSRDAKDRSRKQLDRFGLQVRKTRDQLEKRVSALLQKEANRLNKRLTELFSYLKSAAQNERGVQKNRSKPTRKSAKRVPRRTNSKGRSHRGKGNATSAPVH